MVNMVEILVDAAIMGDKAAAVKHDVGRTTIYRHRKAILQDKAQKAEFELMVKEANVSGIAEKLESVLNTAIEHMQYALQQVEIDADGLNAITNATRTLAEIHFGVKLIASRVDANHQADRSPSTGPRSLVARPTAAA